LWFQIAIANCDKIPTDMIQAGGDILQSEIQTHINSVWYQEELRDKWKKSIILPT
jgi:hypothetical protein